MRFIQRQFAQNKMVTISGMGGHNVPEWVVTMQRNEWSVCSGMGGHNPAEYAWYTDFWYEGIRYRKTLGKVSESVAKRKDATLTASVYNGTYFAKKKKIRFKAFSKKYLDHVELHKKSNTYRRYKTSVKMLTRYFSGRLISEIKPGPVEQYKRRRFAWYEEEYEGRRLSPATINRDVRTLANMMNRAVDWGYLQRNPLAGIEMFKKR